MLAPPRVWNSHPLSLPRYATARMLLPFNALNLVRREHRGMRSFRAEQGGTPMKTRDYGFMTLITALIVTVATISPCTAGWVPSLSTTPMVEDSTDISNPTYGQSASVWRSISMYTNDDFRVDSCVELEAYVDICFGYPNGGSESRSPRAESLTVSGVTWDWVGPPATSPATSVTEGMYFDLNLRTYAAADDSRGGAGQINTVSSRAYARGGSDTSEPSYDGTDPRLWIRSSATTSSQDGTGDYAWADGSWAHVEDDYHTMDSDHGYGWHQYELDAYVLIDSTYGFSAGTSSIDAVAMYHTVANCYGTVSVPAGLYTGSVYGTAEVTFNGYSDTCIWY